MCTLDEILEFLNSNENKYSSLIIIGEIILGIIIDILVTLIIIKFKKTGFKRHKKSNFNDEFRSGSIRILLRNNNNRNNVNVGIGNSNNDGDSNGNNNIESLNLQKPPPSYNDSIITMDIKNKDVKKIYNTEDDEPLISYGKNTKDDTLFTMHQLITKKMKHLSENKKFI